MWFKQQLTMRFVIEELSSNFNYSATGERPHTMLQFLGFLTPLHPPLPQLFSIQEQTVFLWTSQITDPFPPPLVGLGVKIHVDAP